MIWKFNEQKGINLKSLFCPFYVIRNTKHIGKYVNNNDRKYVVNCKCIAMPNAMRDMMYVI